MKVVDDSMMYGLSRGFIISHSMKIIDSVLGFKDKKTPVLQQRNSIFKLLLIVNLPSLLILYLVNTHIPEPYMDEPFHLTQFEAYNRNDFAYW